MFKYERRIRDKRNGCVHVGQGDTEEEALRDAFVKYHSCTYYNGPDGPWHAPKTEPNSVIPSGIAGGYINAQTGKPVEDDGKVLDNNGWRKV